MPGPPNFLIIKLLLRGHINRVLATEMKYHVGRFGRQGGGRVGVKAAFRTFCSLPRQGVVKVAAVKLDL